MRLPAKEILKQYEGALRKRKSPVCPACPSAFAHVPQEELEAGKEAARLKTLRKSEEGVFD